MNDQKKYVKLLELFGKVDTNQCMIYVNTKENGAILTDKLIENGFLASFINGDLTHDIRTKIMEKFRDNATDIIVSTDLFARIIDVHVVGLLINIELPTKKENYIHRVCRSGRYGIKGIAINLVSYPELKNLLHIQELYQTEILELPKDLSKL